MLDDLLSPANSANISLDINDNKDFVHYDNFLLNLDEQFELELIKEQNYIWTINIFYKFSLYEQNFF